jgi:hypothetical protein
MNITLTIPDEVAPRVLQGLATFYNYQPTLLDVNTGQMIPNPEPKAAFAKRMILAHIVTTVRVTESNAALATAVASVDNDIHLG